MITVQAGLGLRKLKPPASCRQAVLAALLEPQTFIEALIDTLHTLRAYVSDIDVRQKSSPLGPNGLQWDGCNTLVRSRMVSLALYRCTQQAAQAI